MKLSPEADAVPVELMTLSAPKCAESPRREGNIVSNYLYSQKPVEHFRALKRDWVEELYFYRVCDL